MSDSRGGASSGPKWGRLAVVLVVIGGVVAFWVANTGDENGTATTIPEAQATTTSTPRSHYDGQQPDHHCSPRPPQLPPPTALSRHWPKGPGRYI